MEIFLKDLLEGNGKAKEIFSFACIYVLKLIIKIDNFQTLLETKRGDFHFYPFQYYTSLG